MKSARPARATDGDGVCALHGSAYSARRSLPTSLTRHHAPAPSRRPAAGACGPRRGLREMLPLLCTFAASLSLALTLTPLARSLALRWGLVDCPDGRRKVQSRPIPVG